MRSTSEPGKFKEYVSTGVEVHVSTTTEVNAVMSLAVSETVTVKANEIQVQTTSAVVGEVIDGTLVRELPLNGRKLRRTYAAFAWSFGCCHL